MTEPEPIVLSQAEAADLRDALARNCTCPREGEAIPGTCSVCRMVADPGDPSAGAERLRHLLAVRRDRAAITGREFEA